MVNRVKSFTRLPPGIPTGRNPHWTESPPEFHVSVGIQDSGDSGHLSSGVTKGPADPAVRGGAILGGRQIFV